MCDVRKRKKGRGYWYMEGIGRKYGRKKGRR
jgi:hypothetical protein